jgi:hypothetical protein
LRIRFQADADLHPAIGLGLLRLEPSIDWRPAQGFLPDATPDPDVLRLAAEDGRVVVSGDIRTFPRHFAEFISARQSPGVILIPQNTPIGLAVEKVLEIWLLWNAEDIENQLRWLP